MVDGKKSLQIARLECVPSLQILKVERNLHSGELYNSPQNNIALLCCSPDDTSSVLSVQKPPLAYLQGESVTA